MSDQNFEQLYKRIQLYAPDCPMHLAQEFINNAYHHALRWYPWSQLRRETEFYFPAVESTGTVTVTNGSEFIQGVGTAFTASMLYRQILVGPITPFYTIVAVDIVTQILTLDRPYEKDSASLQPYNIGQFYMELPSDFGEFDTVVDLLNNWKLHSNFTQSQVDVWDAKRMVTGTPWIIVSAPPRLVTTTNLNIKRVEFWPRVSPGPRTYSVRYRKLSPPLSAPSDRPEWPFTGTLLRKGALAELSIWPGTKTAPNIYFNLDQHKMLQAEFEDGLQEIWKDDQAVSQTAIRYDDWEGVPYAPIDARFLQSHDVF
jgi:hypothetical protein